MLPFCEPGDEYNVPWVGGGFSRCFLQIVGSMSTAGLLYLLGLSAIVLAPKPKRELKAGEGKSPFRSKRLSLRTYRAKNTGIEAKTICTHFCFSLHMH